MMAGNLQSSPAADAAAAVYALPSPLDAISDLRAAARWTIAAFGVVGTALIGGGPLVAVGKVHHPVNAVVAGAGLLVAVIGIGVAIWTTSQVLIPPVTTLATLDSPLTSELRAMIDRAPAEFFGAAATSVGDLLRHRIIAVNTRQKLAEETDPARRRAWQQYLHRAQRNVARTEHQVRWLLAMAHVWQIRAAMRRARIWCLLGLVLVIAGAVTLLIATSPG
jgi:hypothetical protein